MSTTNKESIDHEQENFKQPDDNERSSRTLARESEAVDAPENMIRYRDTETALLFDEPGEKVQPSELLKDSNEGLKVVINTRLGVSFGIVDGRFIDDQAALSKEMFRSPDSKPSDLPGLDVDELNFPELEVGKPAIVTRKNEKGEDEYVLSMSDIESIAATYEGLREDYGSTALPYGGEKNPFLTFEDLVRGEE